LDSIDCYQGFLAGNSNDVAGLIFLGATSRFLPEGTEYKNPLFKTSFRADGRHWWDKKKRLIASGFHTKILGFFSLLTMLSKTVNPNTRNTNWLVRATE
jgi:hypothetical protein